MPRLYGFTINESPSALWRGNGDGFPQALRAFARTTRIPCVIAKPVVRLVVAIRSPKFRLLDEETYEMRSGPSFPDPSRLKGGKWDFKGALSLWRGGLEGANEAAALWANRAGMGLMRQGASRAEGDHAEWWNGMPSRIIQSFDKDSYKKRQLP